MPREFFFNLKCRTNLGKASNWFECFAEVLPVISKRSLGRRPRERFKCKIILTTYLFLSLAKSEWETQSAPTTTDAPNYGAAYQIPLLLLRLQKSFSEASYAPWTRLKQSSAKAPVSGEPRKPDEPTHRCKSHAL